MDAFYKHLAGYALDIDERETKRQCIPTVDVTKTPEYMEQQRVVESLKDHCALSTLEQALFYQLQPKHEKHDLMKQYKSVDTEHVKAREVLICLMHLELEESKTVTTTNEVLVNQLNQQTNEMKQLEKSLDLLKPMDAILKENKSLQQLVFQLGKEKMQLQTQLVEEGKRKLEEEKQRASIWSSLETKFRKEQETRLENANKRIDADYFKVLEYANTHLFKQKEVSVSPDDIRDQMIEYMDRVRTVLHSL